MADLNRLTKLFQAIASQNWDDARALAKDIATTESKNGHHVAAQRLRGALTPNGASPSADGQEMLSGQNGRSAFLSTALTRVPADHVLESLVLSASSHSQLLELKEEWLHREKLARRHIERRSKLLFHGPPGCGKSATAKAIGRELALPVYVVRFDAVVGAYLGQTALHLRQLFHFAESTPSVVLVDEVDALGKRRGSPQDVGELDRVVIALLQELEHSRPAGFLIATSNLATQLDDALWRRFDLTLEFPRPSKEKLRAFAARFARSRRVAMGKPLARSIASAQTFADARKLIEAEERRLAIRSR